MTRGSRRIFSGAPSAILSPWSITTSLSQSPITKAMSCSMTRKVRPSPRRARMVSAMRWRTTGCTPASGSSSIRKGGSTIRFMVSSSRRCCPTERRSPGSSRRCIMPRRLSQLAAAASQPNRSRPMAAMDRLSHTERSRKILTAWKVRPMPSRAISWVLRPSRRRPPKCTAPASGRRRLVIRLKTVVLPEPLGPMRPTTVPAATSNEQSLTARTPPKILVSPDTASVGAASARNGLMRRDGASLLLPRVGRDGHELAAAGGHHRGGEDRDLLAVLDLDHHRLDRHAMPLGEGGELARTPRGGEGAALHGGADLLRVETARPRDSLEGDESGVVGLHDEVGRVGVGLLAVGGHHALRHLRRPSRTPAIVDDGAIHDLGVLVDEALGGHGGAHVRDEGGHLQFVPLVEEDGPARAVDLPDDDLGSPALDLGELRGEIGDAAVDELVGHHLHLLGVLLEPLARNAGEVTSGIRVLVEESRLLGLERFVHRGDQGPHDVVGGGAQLEHVAHLVGGDRKSVV